MSDATDTAWQQICSATDVNDGELKRFETSEFAVVVARVGDEFRVIPPFCPHMAEPLHESGICRGGTLTCSKHLWQWNLLTGEEQGPAGGRWCSTSPRSGTEMYGRESIRNWCTSLTKKMTMILSGNRLSAFSI